MTPHKRGPWSQTEDSYLLSLVHSQGAHNWVRISQMIGSRSPKQCRERYHQNLKPSLNHEPITPEEGAIIERLVGEMGKRWAEIARRLRGRSDNAVKNWWNGGMNRRRRIIVKRDGSSRCPQEFDENNESLSYARPIHSLARPAMDVMIPMSRRGVEAPLISPATSVASVPDSLREAPSLISDSGSLGSMSPHTSKPAHRQLPPPATPNMDPYRRSLSSLPFDCRHSASERHVPISMPNEPLRMLSAPVPIPRPHTTYSSRQQYQLPSFNSIVNKSDSDVTPSKARMSVSAIVD